MKAQPISTPEVTRMETSDRMSAYVGGYRIHVLPVTCEDYPEATHKLVVTNRGELENQPEWDTYETFAEAKAHAEEWVAIAVEMETEWED